MYLPLQFCSLLRPFSLVAVLLISMGCGPSSTSEQPDAQDSAICELGEQVCGDQCCDDGDICGANGVCCAVSSLCGDQCCGDQEVCEGEVCKMDCGNNERCEDDQGVESCCGTGEVCTSQSCFAPVTPCVDFVDCPSGQYCELELGMCLPQPTGEVCQATPEGGAVVPTELWHWDGSEAGIDLPAFSEVMMTPMVANLTDDNQDSVIDAQDIPDVVFIGYQNRTLELDGVLRAVSGDTGKTLWTVTDPNYRVSPGGQVAIGDIDNDGLPEIVACGGTAERAPLIAFEHDGTFKWKAHDQAGAAVALCGQAAPGIADFNADGNPEVFVRHAVVDGATGLLRWEKECRFGDRIYESRDHDPCDYSVAADLNGDGDLELVGGNVAYHPDGTTYYDHTLAFDDGYPAVGDLNLDGIPEVVVVHSSWAATPPLLRGMHEFRALQFDGSPLWGPFDVNSDNPDVPDTLSLAGGGPPTLANFDEDPEPEIGLATAFHYIVFEANGDRKWYRNSQDNSSRKTGSSVFDFNGDGAAEVVYSDHSWMRVYDGATGDITFCLCNTSGTLWEYPVTSDVNNDGATEIILASNKYRNLDCPSDPALALDACTADLMKAGKVAQTSGVRAFANPEAPWVATRRIWNQHSYHITNVSESGAIPKVEPPNWLVPGLNNFRQNVQPGASNLPDLSPVDASVGLQECPDLQLNFSVVNRGWAASTAGIPVSIYVERNGTYTLTDSVQTQDVILPGQREQFSLPYERQGGEGEDVQFRIVINDPTQMPTAVLNECLDTNNSTDAQARCSVIE